MPTRVISALMMEWEVLIYVYALTFGIQFTHPQAKEE